MERQEEQPEEKEDAVVDKTFLEDGIGLEDESQRLLKISESTVETNDEGVPKEVFPASDLEEVSVVVPCSTADEDHINTKLLSNGVTVGAQKENSVKSQQRGQVPFVGVILVLLCALFGALSVSLLKFLTAYSPVYTSFTRAFLVTLTVLPFLIYSKAHPFPKGNRCLLLLRGLIAGTGMITKTVAAYRLPVGDLISLMYFNPVLVLLFSRFYLKEYCSIFHVFICALSITGIFLIVQPSYIFGDDGVEHLDPVGIACALATALCIATYVVITRRLKNLSRPVLLFNSFSSALVVCAGATGVFQKFEGVYEYIDALFFIGVALTMGLSQLCLIKALEKEDASIISIIRVSEVVLGFLLQLAFFSAVPSLYSVAGSFLVVVAAVGIGLNSLIRKLPEKHRWRPILGRICCISSEDFF